MTFSDNFNGTTGQLLSARTGWTLGVGADCLTVNASGILTKGGATAGAINVYYRPDDASTTPRVKADLLASTCGPVLLASGSDAASFNAYFMRQNTATGLRVYRINNGVVEGTPIINLSGLTDTLGIELRATVSGGNPTLQVYRQGVAVGSAFTDSTGNKKTTGRRGIGTNTTSTISVALDNYEDNYSAPTAFAITPPAVPFYEGVLGASSVTVAGTYSGTIASIEARLVDGNGNAVSGFDWSVKVASPAGNSFSFSFASVPTGGPYRVQVRDSAVPGTVTAGAVDRYVGAIALVWGQSQADRLFSLGAGTVTIASESRAFTLRLGDKSQPGTPTFSPLSSGTGSGIVAAANQWQADTNNIPVLFVDVTYQGSSIDLWISDGQRPGMAGGWNLWSGLATTMLTAVGRASLMIFMQGTANVGETGYAPKMVTLKGMADALLSSPAPLAGVIPHARSNDGLQTWAMREQQRVQAQSGVPWVLLCWMLDWVMDADASPHQLNGDTGNPRGGTRVGRGLAKALYNSALDIGGPQIVACQFTNGTRNVIEITFDRDIETPSGATSSLAGWFVSADGSTWAEIPTGYTAAITGARKLQITKTNGSWSAGARVDLLRGVPFQSNSGLSDYAGPESSVETDYLSKVLTDATSFDGGRGMSASPVMGSGFAVADAGVVPALPSITDLGSSGLSGGTQLGGDGLN
jgi:hypothetical protein